MQELTKWLTNNWRPYHSMAKKPNGLKIKRSEVLWHTKQDLVYKEIANLLGVEKADSSTDHWFEKRLPAIKNILDRMTDVESAELDEEVKRINNEGFPDDIKRQYVLSAGAGAIAGLH